LQQHSKPSPNKLHCLPNNNNNRKLKVKWVVKVISTKVNKVTKNKPVNQKSISKGREMRIQAFLAKQNRKSLKEVPNLAVH
jgi:primosomal replication protein N